MVAYHGSPWHHGEVPKIARACVVCGKEFFWTGARQKVCSQACQKIALRQRKNAGQQKSRRAARERV